MHLREPRTGRGRSAADASDPDEDESDLGCVGGETRYGP